MKAKDFRKAAFAVGFGFTLGKFCAKLFVGVVDKLTDDMIKDLASKGNESAQKYCQKHEIKYEQKEDITDKVNIGFHA